MTTTTHWKGKDNPCKAIYHAAFEGVDHANRTFCIFILSFQCHLLAFLFSHFNVTCSFAAESPGFKGAEADGLDAREQAIIPIPAFTVNGNIERLKPALVAGLKAGLSVNEIKEILVQLYAYAGFPRSLNAIHAFMVVMQEREAKGIKDTVGKEATPLSKDMDKDAYGAAVRRKLAGVSEEAPAQGYQLFTPVIDTYLKEHLFADIFARDVLDHRSRELVTIAALAAISGTEGQLRFHLGAAMNSGFRVSQLQAFIAVLKEKVGHREAEVAQLVLSDVVQKRQENDEKRARD
jgi:4-carboxymuconolactone decarboxylase